jgi:hypothetical protein
MRYTPLLLFGSFVFIGSVFAKEAPLRTPEQRFGSLAAAEEPSFRRHVVPLISRAGCSGRECHGSFQGRGGFQLSLFGYDFEKDHKQMTVNADGDEKQVRINKEQPEKSLLLTKGTNEEPHKGKERYKKGSWEYNLMLKWIQGGAKLDVEATGEFSHLDITPKEIVFKKPGDKIQLRVLAHWKDGTVEDVTQLTRFRSNDDSVSTVSITGLVESKDKGDTHIVAFYDNGVDPVPVMLPVSDKVGTKYPKVATASKVDEHVIGKLQKLGIIPSEVCTDTEFLRRVSLDLTGTLPTPDQITAFLADKSPLKRSAKIHDLLKTPAYAAWWTTRLSDFLGNNARVLRGNGANNYGDRFSRQWYDWMQVRIAKNEPYDQMMAGIILATGRTKPGQTYEEFAREMSGYFRAENPLNFAERPNMPYFWQRSNLQKAEEKALAFSHSFLGVRIECAQCHKHPFDQWTQNDFKSFQAFFEGVNYGGKGGGGKAGGGLPAQTGETVTYASLTKEIKDAVPPDPKGGNNQKALGEEFEKRVKAGEPAPWLEVFTTVRDTKGKLSEREIEQMKKKNPNFDGRVLTPRVLGGEEVMLKEYPDPRAPLMEWLRSPKNPYFAKAWVNRVWATYFHRGLVEPADDMNLANPPVNEGLMDYLADGFVKNGYNMAWLHKEILNSATYQRSWKPNDTNKNDEKNFSRFVIRRLPAEVVVDGITQATLGSERLASFRDDIENRAIGPNANAGRAGGGGGKGGVSNYSLNIFGKPVRETNCDCERTTDPTLLQTLFTRNDPELLNALEQSKGAGWVDEIRKATTTASPARAKGDIAQLEGLIRKMEFKLKENPDRREQMEAELKAAKEKLAKLVPSPTATKPTTANLDDYINLVFLRTVSRPPTATEIEKARADLTAATSPAEGVRELLWAMLNTREFMVNH